ncbi:MAG: YeeE/YedE family protein [Saprospiraceae bacterium]|nr:YeeE/YedE family protein [Saprospiraceae bacterium]HQV65915.1 YeeE/YedE thiosulfate transporter family protein [Saprospiraceae bacterium]HRG41066.1 YeeE/YedE thiosulfate transporter family protein [Saprospiraceae bacterium]
MTDFFTQSWSWWFTGIVISSIMFILLFLGQSFGFSSNLRTICAAAGAGKNVSFFNFNWKSQLWNIVFLAGAIIGGTLAGTVLNSNEPIVISPSTVSDLQELGFSSPTGLQPDELFAWESVATLKGFLILAIGGLFIGFGSRYAGGCTSGHAISGLSSLQIPSLIAVIGFFIGGLLMTHILFPLIF